MTKQVKRIALSKWKEIDPKEALSAKACKAFEAYKELYKEVSALRNAFEAQVQADAASTLPDAKTQEIMFSYKFGKLSMAIGPKAAKPDGVSRTALTDLKGLGASLLA